MDVRHATELSAADGRRLEPLQVAHSDEMATVLADPALYAFTGGGPPTTAQLRRRYAAQVAGDPDGRQSWLNWVMRDAAVGYIQATVEDGRADVAWVIGTRHQGRGHARAAATATVTWLRTAGVDTVVAHVHRDHLASTAVARGLGLVATGRVVDGEVEWASLATTPPVTTRAATGEDLTEVMTLWEVAAENAGRPADTEDAVRHLVDHDPEALQLATVGQVVIGSLVAGHDGWRCHLYRLAVHPTWRGQGVARLLVTAAEDRFRALGAGRVDAMVLDTNADGAGVWRRLGYAPQPDWSRWVKPLVPGARPSAGG